MYQHHLARTSKQRTTKTASRPVAITDTAVVAFAAVDFSLDNRFSTETAANYLGIRGETLARWRSERRILGDEQPNFYRIGKKIFYLKNDLDAFLLKRGEASLATSRAS